MKKRWLGYALWLLLAACLYFFENGTGTRIILACSLLSALIPGLRAAFFSPDGRKGDGAPEPTMVSVFTRREAEEPGDVRPYAPGDPARHIHWKLSAKKDELLIRETAVEEDAAEEKRRAAQPADGGRKTLRRRLAFPALCAALLCLLLLLALPEARRGAGALCNGVFAASERINAYAYDYFPVPEGQSVWLAAALLGITLSALIAWTALLRSRAAALGLMAACTLFQVYFGLPFPGWINVPLYGLFALWMMRRPLRRESLLACGAALLAVSLLMAFLFPGVDAATEAASETARDCLSRMAGQIAGSAPETPEGETETRRAHTLSLETGDREARIGREYRLVTVEEEQIAMPRWVDYLKIILLLALSAALVILPFTPFLLLNARKKKAREARKAFSDENVGKAVCAIFRQVILWLDETGCGAGNLLYRDWAERLPATLPEDYARRFARCARDFEEAAYSSHALPEEKRRQALELLKETETALFRTADWRQRLRIKYWMCLCE